MDKLRQLFIVRSSIDTKRQPRHQDLIQTLTTSLNRSGQDHPYDNCAALYHEPAYYLPSAGLPADTRSLAFAYRLTSITAVIRNSEARIPYRIDTVVNNSRAITEDYKRTGAWLPLSNYTAGHLTARRAFHWWTPLDISTEPVITNAHCLGIPNDLIVPHSIILRLRFQSNRDHIIASVPTAVHGFDSIIFLSSRCSDRPQMGRTINLHNPFRLVPGIAEFVVGPVPIEALECKPVFIGDAPRDAFPVRLKELIDPLLTYYKEEER